MSEAEKIVNQALFGIEEIEYEPGNYLLHKDTFLAAVERAIAAEREACAKVAESVPAFIDGLQRHPALVQQKIAAAIRSRGQP